MGTKFGVSRPNAVGTLFFARTIAIWKNSPTFTASNCLTKHFTYDWPELTVLKVEVFERNPYGNFFLNGRFLGDYQIDKIAEHDGLGPAPFRSWFNKEFSGQRIIFGQTALNYSIF